MYENKETTASNLTAKMTAKKLFIHFLRLNAEATVHEENIFYENLFVSGLIVWVFQGVTRYSFYILENREDWIF